MCTFFKYVSGGLQAANKFVSLSPAYKTKYAPVKDYDGQWKSSVYFECHYFDVSLDPATGQPSQDCALATPEGIVGRLCRYLAR